MQLITHKLGGKVEPAVNKEYGKAELEVTTKEAQLFASTPENKLSG